MGRSTPIRLLVVNRHALIRAGLVRLLDGRAGVRIVGEAGTRPLALAEAARYTPDVILLEPHPESDLGLDAIPPLLVAAGAHARVLVLTSRADQDFHRMAIRSGARGILDVDQPAETLFKAIEKIYDGDVWIERRLVTSLVTSDEGRGTIRARIDSLTPRERDVLRLVSEGLKNKQIAERLSVTDVTVRHHLTSIFGKLDVRDRLSLVVFAFGNGLAEPRRHERS